MNEKINTIKEKMNSLTDGLTNVMYKDFSLVEWRPILAVECQVYVYNEIYLGKRFDQINYSFCSQDTAKEILIDNLYALLRYKYFPKATDDTDKKISEIIKSFTTNLKSVLIKVSFDKDADCKIVNFIPDGCVAFRNGVYDFRNDEWLFIYDKIDIPKLHNAIYLYDDKYIIPWYININFSPLGIDIKNTDLKEFFEIIKDFNVNNKNYCFELMYNMSHNIDHQFEFDKFKHLCEIIGYLCLQSFSQHFVLFIGTGQNGKNSLFDGCFTPRVVPMPTNIDMNSIEENQFVTGALENKSHNIFLETDPSTKTKSEMLKALTGGPLQSIQHKGVDIYPGYINCKFIWAGNDQEKIKFSDNTNGFRRRINLFETYYKWDPKKQFLKKGDYYDTTFSEDLRELKEDITNIIVFIYFAMFGVKEATKNFTSIFRFAKNDWRLEYSDIDFDLKDRLDNITITKIMDWYKRWYNTETAKTAFFDMSKKALYLSDTVKEFNITNYGEFINSFMKNEEIFIQYFVEHDAYVSLKFLQEISGASGASGKTFSQDFKKLYSLSGLTYLSSNKSYAKCSFRNGRLKIID